MWLKWATYANRAHVFFWYPFSAAISLLLEKLFLSKESDCEDTAFALVYEKIMQIEKNKQYSCLVNGLYEIS
ncbi:hypothetical protein T4D_15927 [Trichinella pseudospiralis]|uniref:Uncharacterized protein n=1 Tax=Trichinella pseudospiralis TaxID=6337 RepID=A0A0V1FRF9_TRIPS|nr:hypothetical protein T4D_15927 [Trichinella pseudospiralis]